MTGGLKTTNLLYCFWLPAGKDEFGFARNEEAPLSGTAYYRRDLERTISDNFAEQNTLLRGLDDSLARLTRTGNIRLVIKVPVGHDGELDAEAQAKRIITDCVTRLVLAGKSRRDIAEFFAVQFGWRDDT